MSSDPLTQFYFSTAYGMNNRMNEYDLQDGQEKYVLLAQNCRFAQSPASVIKRQPLAYYNETTMSTTQGMCGLYRFYGAFGPQLIAVCGSTVYVGNDSTGTMTAIRTLTTSNETMMFLTYDSLMIASNGQDPIFVYDGGAVTWELGSCQALTAASGTGISATNVSYQVTIDADAYICGAVSNTIASLSNQAVDLAYIPLGTEGATNRKIYRQDSGTSGEYKLVATISDNSTTTYTDNTPSASLGAAISSVTDPFPVGAWILMFGERLFITCDPNNPNWMYYSEPFLPGYIQVNTNLDYLPIDEDDGDRIQGIVVDTGTMLCIKQNNVRKLNISNAQSNFDPSQWSAEPPFAFVGAAARYSICQTPVGVVFLAWDAWYLCKGSVQPFLAQFDTTQILPAAYDNVVCCFNDGQLYASYTSLASGDQYPTQVMVWDYKLNQFSIDTYSASCFASATGVGESGELYIGDSNQGFIYKAEEGDVFSNVSSLTQAQLGTTAGTYVGGTQNTPFIQIGESVAPSAIPVGVCLLWDDTVGTPGGGWTEITAYPYTYPVISLTSGLTGGSSSHVHTLAGTTTTAQGGGTNSGNQGDPQGMQQAHDHTVSGNSDAMFANPNYFGLRIFYKNSNTTEYDFPIGSILMWDQVGAPDGWLPYGQSNNGYLNLISPPASAANWVVGTVYTVGQYVTATDPFTSQQVIYYCQVDHTAGVYDNDFNAIYGYNPSGSPNIPSSGAGGASQQYPISPITFADDLAAGFWIAQYSNLGVTVVPIHAHPYGIVATLETSAPIPYEPGAWQSSGGNLGGQQDHTHLICGVTNGTTTGGNWDLDRLEINFIKKLVTGETPWDGTTSKNIVALFWDTGAPASPSNGWSEVGATYFAYSAIVSYVAGNMVTYGGSYYQCLQVALNQEPDTSPAYWQGGAYNATTAYTIGQYATYSGTGYQCIQAGTGQQPNTSPAYWQVINIYIKSTQSYVTPQANNGYTHSHGNTPAITTSYDTTTWGNSNNRTQCDMPVQHTLYCSTNTMAIPNPAYVSFRLWTKQLGLMVNWNNAVDTAYTNGLYYSPPLQLNVQSFGELYFNASKLPTDSINFYFNTAASMAALSNGLTPTWATNTFTSAAHGLANTNVVTILDPGSVTGLSLTQVYYVVNAMTNTFQVSLTSGGSAATITGSGSTGVNVLPWEDKINSSDTVIAVTPNVWVSYVVAFIAGNTEVSNPTLVMANDYILEFSYSRSGTVAETSVEFIYTTGRNNSQQPYVDKIYKRFASDHSGSQGQVQVTWTTDNASNSWTWDLSAFPTKYVTYFQDSAMGETLSMSYYKNDLNDFILRQFSGQFSACPMII